MTCAKSTNRNKSRRRMSLCMYGGVFGEMCDIYRKCYLALSPHTFVCTGAPPCLPLVQVALRLRTRTSPVQSRFSFFPGRVSKTSLSIVRLSGLSQALVSLEVRYFHITLLHLFDQCIRADDKAQSLLKLVAHVDDEV